MSITEMDASGRVLLPREIIARLELNAGDKLAIDLSLIHISEPTRLLSISYAVFCLKKKTKERSKTAEQTTAYSTQTTHDHRVAHEKPNPSPILTTSIKTY